MRNKRLGYQSVKLGDLDRVPGSQGLAHSRVEGTSRLWNSQQDQQGCHLDGPEAPLVTPLSICWMLGQGWQPAPAGYLQEVLDATVFPPPQYPQMSTC